MQCKDENELLALAKENGYALTKEEAEAYLDVFYNLKSLCF